MAKADIIILDPPWHYSVYDETSGSGRAATKHYKTAPMSDFADLPILEAASKNALLLVWTTYPQLMALDPLVQSWNEQAKHKKDRFVYKTVLFTWAKLNVHWKKTAKKILASGVTDEALEEVMIRCFANGNGFYTMANSEIMAVYRRGDALKGGLKRMSKSVRNFQAVSIGEHSEKPDKFNALVDEIFPHASKLECFARRHYPGWTCIGKVISKRDIHLDLQDFIDGKKPQELQLI